MAKESQSPDALTAAESTSAVEAPSKTAPVKAEKAASAKPANPQAPAAARRQRTRQQYSMPFITNTLKLKSFHAQQTFERGFDICSEAIFTLSVVMRVVAPEEQAVEVDAAVDRELSAVAKDLKAELDRLNKFAESHGVSTNGVTYSMPREFTPRVTSPRAVLYLSLLRDLDLLVERVDTLWLAGEIKDKEHNQSIFQWKRRILRVSGTIRNLVFRAMASAQRKEIDNVQDPRVGTPLDPDAAKTVAEGSAEHVRADDQTQTEDSAQDLVPA